MSSTDRLLEIMARLRDPKDGCAWDLEQRFETIAPYTIEEAYEVDDAIRRGNLNDLREELGDLLLQVVFHARMAEEISAFKFDDVVTGLCDKLVRRHPNVFADAEIETAEAQVTAWEAQKAAERKAVAQEQGRTASALDGVALGLPALMRAHKLLGRAARAGMGKPDRATQLTKISERLTALHQADSSSAREHIGALLLDVTALARALDVEPEEALRDAGASFEQSFRASEAQAASGRKPAI